MGLSVPGLPTYPQMDESTAKEQGHIRENVYKGKVYFNSQIM